eukprot:TRINITY_DN6056_c0_g1_i2.p1 TRINITY_DN6056_c0_g1~~TRINITY_DN6056_c0_g1_i2.p1  ORF type:complete len:923 (-),score=229.64 TRINITY_DN6056_c0_g1_i2:638-3406(-)
MAPTCPSCGNLFLPDSVFCRHCGQKRDGAPPSFSGHWTGGNSSYTSPLDVEFSKTSDFVSPGRRGLAAEFNAVPDFFSPSRKEIVSAAAPALDTLANVMPESRAELALRPGTSPAHLTPTTLLPSAALTRGMSPAGSSPGGISAEHPGRSPEHQGSYEAMRRTLQETQKRCEHMLEQLQRETEANRELTRTRSVAEERCRKLQDQVNQQAEEMTNLARQRLSAEEKLEDLSRRHRLEDEMREKDHQRRLASTQHEADARCQQMQAGLVDKLHATRKTLVKVKQDFERLKADHSDSRKSVCALNEAMKQLMAQTERSVYQRLETLTKHELDQRLACSDVTRDLEVRWSAEHELRISESTAWSQKYASLAAEHDQLQARFHGEIAQLNNKLDETRRSSSEGQGRLEAEVQRSRAEAEDLRKGLASQESMKTAAIDDHRASLDSIKQLEAQLAESAILLEQARSGQEALREQVEEQHRRLTDASNLALASCKEEQSRAMELLQGKVSLAEEKARRSEAELENSRAKGIANSQETASFKERMQLELDAARRETQDHKARAEATQGATQKAAIEADAQLTALRTQVAELQACIDRTTRESALERERLESQAGLERERLETQASIERERLDNERRRLEDLLASQTQTARESQEQYEKWRASHMDSLRQVHEESSSRAFELEREKDSCKMHVDEITQKLEATKGQLGNSEDELARLRSELAESLTSAQVAKRESDQQKQEASGMNQRWSDELHQASTALAAALRNEADLTQKLHDATSHYQQERQSLENVLQQARRSAEMQDMEKEHRIDRLKAEYETRLRVSESRLSAELAKEQAKAEAVLRENDQLRQFMSEQRKTSSSGMSTLHSQLEGSIVRLQRHTDELRGDIGVPPSAVPSLRTGAAYLSSAGDSSMLSQLQRGLPNSPGHRH